MNENLPYLTTWSKADLASNILMQSLGKERTCIDVVIFHSDIEITYCWRNLGEVI